ncbi:N-acetylmuramoyl-L-alanine amidase [bacterium]|nr:N-acetylmuramoyl-L-alanine amidase [bacterium]
MKNIFTLLLFSIAFLNAQISGLSGWNLFVDPGHSQTENMGVNGYSEAEEVLGTALHLREMLLTQTDIDTVWSSRYNDDVNVSLYERTDDANARGAAWYHSIHSNAGGPTNNDVLLLWGELWDGTPDPPVGGEAMSDIMVEILADVMRIPQNGWGSTGDCSFYNSWVDPTPCTQSGFQGPYLSVNRRSNMPSELSEQGHHTNPLQNQLDMNEEYKRMLAYSMFWTILDNFGIDRPFPGILAGIITDTETNIRVNGATVIVNGESYTTDTYESLFHEYSENPEAYHNGFYYFEGLPDASFEVVVTAEGYYSDTLQIDALSDDFVTFQDIYLIPNVPPIVLASHPENADTTYPAWDIPYFDFSRGMDRTSLENAFSIEPYIEGTFYFTADNKRMAYLTSDTLDFLTNYTITIAGTAVDSYGHPLDGNQDGVGGDDWSIWFRTGPPDIIPPAIVDIYPVSDADLVDLRPIVNIVWDEELEPASIQDDLIKLERLANLQLQETILEHHVIDGKSVLVLYSMDELLDVEPYRVRIFPGFEDLFGNVQGSGTVITFTTSNFDYSITNIDNFENNPLNYWWEIQQSGSNLGIVTEECNRDISIDHTVLSEGSNTSLRINYGWNPSAGSWLIREYLSGGPARDVHFTSSRIMQAFVFGDGNGNKFRFCVDDNIYGAGAHEVSPWYTIDWYGWRLISWDMAVDGTGTWIGDGNLDGTLEFDSIQLSYTPGQPTTGTYYIDELRVVNREYLALDQNGMEHPLEFALLPNYPNPFNPWTSIPFTLAQKAEVRINIYDLKGKEIAHLISGTMEAGQHVTRWNASQMASGMYLVKMEANDISITRKITVLK